MITMALVIGIGQLQLHGEGAGSNSPELCCMGTAALGEPGAY